MILIAHLRKYAAYLGCYQVSRKLFEYQTIGLVFKNLLRDLASVNAM